MSPGAAGPGAARWSRREVVLLGGSAVLAAVVGCTGTEALPDPVAPRLQVTADRFGLRADGRTDDGVALQRALDEVAAQGGGTLLLPSGRYGLGRTLALPSHVRLLGERGTTLLDLKGNQTMIDLFDCTEGIVEGVRFEGRGTAVVDGRGAVHGTRGRRHGPVRCQILDNVMVGVGTCGVALDHAVDVLIRGNRVVRSAEHGIYLSGNSHRCVIQGNRLEMAGIDTGRTVAGIKLANLGCVDNQVVGNVVVSPQADGLLCDSGAQDNLLTRNQVRRAPLRGVRLNVGADRNEVRSNLVDDAGKEGLRDFGGRDNRFLDNTVDSPRADAGIRLDERARGTVVEGNSVVAVSADGWGIDVYGCPGSVQRNFLSPSVRFDVRLATGC